MPKKNATSLQHQQHNIDPEEESDEAKCEGGKCGFNEAPKAKRPAPKASQSRVLGNDNTNTRADDNGAPKTPTATTPTKAARKAAKRAQRASGWEEVFRGLNLEDEKKKAGPNENSA